MNQWQIGDVKITRIVELEVAGGTKFILPDATPEACRDIAWLKPHFMTEQGKLIMSVHALVVDTGARRIVVDTCIGNDKERNIPSWSHLQTSFLSDLAAAGYPRESIDTVLCTHLHVDHVGWNTMLVDGRWVPTFPNARYLIAQQEWRYWDEHGEDAQYGSVLADSVRPVIEAGLVDFVSMEHRLCDEVWLEPTPGHTAGHVSVHIASRGTEALITGDCIHHPVSDRAHRLDQFRRLRQGAGRAHPQRSVGEVCRLGGARHRHPLCDADRRSREARGQGRVSVRGLT